MKRLLNITMMSVAVAALASCGNDDDFTESIYDTNIEVVDENSGTAPFDKWLYDNFVLPYNTEIQYKFNFPASNMDFQLSPADYKKSQLLANYIKYLFYDVYTKYAGEKFMKEYGPRIFHFIGSSAYAPTTGTETLGYASAGVKITLINVNNMKMWTEATPYTSTDMEMLNKDQFHTMHHEFSHILHQTKTYPVTFGLVTPGTYEPRNWQERDSVESHRLGYITQYGSSANYEDFVETLSCTITDTDYRWMTLIIDATCNGGVRDGDKEAIMTLIDSLEIAGVNDPAKAWNNFSLYTEYAQNSETLLYEPTGRIVPSFHQADAKSHSEVALKYEKLRDFTSFRDYLNWLTIDTSDTGAGINAILKKIDIATKWYTEKWGLHLYELRREVRQRQAAINEWTQQNVTIYDVQ